MGKKTQVKQEVGPGTGRIRKGYQNGNFNTPKKPSFKSSIIKLKDDVFTQRRPYDANKYEESIETLANYVQL